MSKLYVKLLVVLFVAPFILQSQTPGTTCANPFPLYPQTGCGNTSGPQFAGYLQMESASGANVPMTGTSTLNPACTSDNETTQAVEWLEVTATATSFTINNETSYIGGGAATAEKRDYIVYSGPCGSLTQIACFSEVLGGTSVAVTGLTVGQTYLIMVSQSSTALAGCPTCTGVATCITSNVPSVPTNDNCSSAYALTTNVSYESNNANATADGSTVCQNPASGSVENNVWFSWCAPSNWSVGQPAYLSVNNQICNSTSGLQLSVFGPNPNCASIVGGTATSLLCQNPGVTTNYSYTFTPTANNCYLINIDGFGATGCTFVITISTTSVVCVPPNITVNAASICPSGSATLSASGATSYSWSPSTGLSATSGSSVIASPSVTTVYTITGTTSGCSASKTTTLTVNPTPTVTANASNTVICPGNSVTLTGGGASTYTWTGGVSNGVAFSPTTTASYTVTGTSAAGCTNTAVQTISISPTPTVTASSSNSVICPGNTVTLTGAGASTYTWTGGVTNGVAFSPTATASYTVIGSSAAGCTNTAVKSITVNPTPTITAIASNSVICLGNTVTLTGSGASTYTWTGGVTNGVAFSPTATASYTVTGTSALGCTNTAVQSITVNPIPTTTASTSGTISCSTPTITLNSTLAGTNYTWTAPAGGSVGSTNAQSTSASGAAGVYTLNVQSAAGCTYSTTTTVTQNTTAPTGVNAGSNQTLTCSSSTVGLNGSVTTPTNATVLWTGPSVSGSTTSYTTSANGAGVYTLTATNPVNGCTASSTVQVAPSAGAPSVIINPVTNTITCTNTLVTVSISSTVSPANYVWSGPGIVSGNGTGTITVNQGGAYNFTLTNTTNSCTTSNNQVVVQNTNPPTPTASNSTTLTCTNTTAALTGTGGGTYSWNGPGTILGGTTATPTVNTAGNYTLTVTAANGCTAVATTSVTQNTNPPTPTASNSTTLTCTTTTAALTGTGGGTYSWNGPGTILGSTTATPTVNTAGNFTLTVTAANGCTAVATTSVLQNINPPTPTASNSTTLTCTNTTAALTGTGGGTYSWNGPGTILGGATATPTVNTAGNYTLTVTAANGCTAVATTSVSQNINPPTPTASNTTTLTCTTTTAALTGTGGGTYSWNGPGTILGGTTATPTVNTAGNYTLTVTAANGCTAVATTSVSQNINPPTPTASNTTTLTCTTTTAALTGTGGGTYSWNGPGTILGGTTATPTVNTAGDYTLTVTAANGCTAVATTSVSQNINPPTPTASNTTTLTCTTTTATLTGTGGGTYSWNGPGTILGGTTAAPTVNTAGNYTLTVTAANGCTAVATTSVSQNINPPSPTASNSTTLTCTTTTAALLGGPATGLSYQWIGSGISGSTTGQNATATLPGTYTLLVTDAITSCTALATTSVLQNTTSPTGLSAGTNQTLTCPSNSLTLNGSITTPANASVLWTGPSISGSTNSLTTTVNGAGVYTLTATDPANSCSVSTTVEVFPNAGSPIATITSTALVIDCNNSIQSATVTSVPNTDVTYSWNNTPSSLSTDGSIATFTNANTYICTVTNTLNNCSTPVQVVVTTNTTIPTTTASVSGILTCSTLSVDLNSSLSGMNYTWTAPSSGFISSVNTQSTSVTGTGNYTLSVLNPANGCSYTTTISVTQNTTSPVGLSAGINQTLTCPSNSLTLNGSITTPTNAAILWTGPSVSGSTNSFTTTVNGAGVYTLTATDPVNSCSVAATVEVFPNAGAPIATITSTALVIDCNNSIQSATVTSVPNTDVTYSWNNTPSSLSTDGSIATFTNANTYICNVTNTLSNCSTPVQVVVTTNTTIPTIAITPTQTLTCANPSVAITVTTSPNTGLTYAWNGTLLSGQGTGLITVNQAGTYSVTITNTANGCSNTANTQVDADTNVPTATITASSINNIITCSNQVVSLQVNVSPVANYTYTWSNASNSNTINVNSAGVYSVTAINPSTGCFAVAFYTVTSNTVLPDVITSNTIIPCNTNTITVIASSTSAVTYSWTSTNGTLLGNGTSGVIVGSTGDYIVTVTDINNGCINTASASVTQTTINASFTANPLSGTAPLLVDFTNTSNNPLGTTYSWNFGDSNSATTTNANNTYTSTGVFVVSLTATDPSGLCTATSTINIEVIDNSLIEVPNVFTPNGDGVNDAFSIKTKGIKEINCDIFDRWGLKVYTITSIKDTWDGINQSAGTYFYIINAKGYDGKEFKQQGFISLFK